MPAAYEAIRDAAVKKGMPLADAKTKAARIYNWLRKKHPSMAKLSNKKGAA